MGKDTAKRKQEEKKLEKPYRDLIDNALVGIFQSSVDGDILYVNDTLIKMAEFDSAEEMLADGAVPRWKNPGQRKAFVKELRGAGRVTGFEAEVLTKTGKTLDAIISATLEGDLIFGMVMDVTVRKEAIEVLRRSEEKYRSIFENIIDVYYRADLEGNLVSASPSGAELLGYDSVEGMIGKNIAKTFYHNSEDREAFLKELKKQGKVANYEVTLKRKDGTPVFIETSSYFVYDEAGAPVGVEGIFRDVTARKEAEKALHRSRGNLETILNSVEEGIMVIGGDYKIIEANPTIEGIAGLPKEEIIGKHCYEVSHSRDSPCRPPDDICPLKEVFKTGKPFTVTHKHFDSQERITYVEVTAYPIKGKNGAVESVIEVTRDITGYIQKEDIQAVLNKMIRLSVEDIPMKQILEKTIEMVVSIPWLTLKQKGAIFLAEGYPETLVMKAQRGLDEKLLTSCKEVPFGRCICGRAAASREITFVDRIDERHDTRYEGMPPHGHYCVPIMSGGRVLGVMNLYVEEGHRRSKVEEEFLLAVAITLAGVIERRRIEDERRESEEKFRDLFEESMDGRYTLNSDYVFTSVNKAMKEMTGYKGAELLWKKKLDIIAEEDRERVKERFTKIMEGAEPLPIEFQMVHKKGHPIDVEVRSAPIVEGGKIVGVQDSARDVTFRRALEKELEEVNIKLEQSNQLKGLFTDILRHDLLNPTGVVRNIVEIMECEEALKDSGELTIIKRNIIKLEAIIESASQYAKFESMEKLDKSELDLTEMIKNIVVDMDTYAKDKKMNVEFKSAGKHKIKASPAIESVFVNLLSNAIKYSPEDSDIKIAIEDDGASKKISFADHGEGIADEHKDAVFDRFARRHKEGVKGTGLGLAIVRRIVEMHDGRVWVEDNPDGKGSVFFVELPKEKKER